MVVSKGKAPTGRGQDRACKGRGPGGVAACWGLACPLPSALDPRLSPEIYLKRPAHSDDWRLDIMLKKKAVRRGVRLERRRAGGALGWRWVRRDCSVGEGRESEALREETCLSWLGVWHISPLFPP